eukprot:CAMPEP_0168529254 /NCGR_PEP_ID=MMETSP0405-20121227/13788_1 /TAXON_ID=498012 /ORGANISM="Trichosphaerium sp, Strain Am-I-7 wt" /LENGTH=181 /DNA_ID=CAMNT_0008552921 /DNA_START=319 /DNA_END=861 /DNA_ORIENTATION=+
MATVSKKNSLVWLVCGMPNTGKSSVINALSRRGAASTAAKPGHTRGQTVYNLRVTEGLGKKVMILDTPGITLPEKSADIMQGYNLALCGCLPSNTIEPGPVRIAEYMLKILNHTNQQHVYMDFSRMKEPVDDIDELLSVVQKRFGKQQPNQAASFLLQKLSAGEMGGVILDEYPQPREKKT